jgi:hypothetical protein
MADHTDNNNEQETKNGNNTAMIKLIRNLIARYRILNAMSRLRNAGLSEDHAHLLVGFAAMRVPQYKGIFARESMGELVGGCKASEWETALQAACNDYNSGRPLVR